MIFSSCNGLKTEKTQTNKTTCTTRQEPLSASENYFGSCLLGLLWVLSVEIKSAKSNCSVILDLAFTRAYKAIFEAIKNREISSNLALLSIFLSLKCRLFAIYNDRRGSNYCCGRSVITHPLCTIPTEVYQKTT